MSNVAKLKKKAAEFEQKRQFDKALALYVQILDASKATGGEDLEVALLNRVGDLFVRQGNTADALTYYERAVDLYADGGFHNNAIALCNKILRYAPGRAEIYYKLGKISAQKGFKSDAKQNFLEYADRMRKAGQTDEAFRALREFADLCPDQDDIRLMLAEQLSKTERKPEALEQLQVLYQKFESEGRTAEQRATLERMRAIDPTVEAPEAGTAAIPKQQSDLVFLDLSWDDAAGAGAAKPGDGARAAPRPATPPAITLVTPQPLTGARVDAGPPSLGAVASNGHVPVDGLSLPMDGGAGGAIAGPEAASVGGGLPAPAGLELGSFDGGALGGRSIDATAPHAHDLVLPGELPPLDAMGLGAPDAPIGGDTLELILPDSFDGLAGGDALAGGLAAPLASLNDESPVAGGPGLGGGADLPFLDVGEWSSGPAASREDVPPISLEAPMPNGNGAEAAARADVGAELPALDLTADALSADASNDAVTATDPTADLPMLDSAAVAAPSPEVAPHADAIGAGDDADPLAGLVLVDSAPTPAASPRPAASSKLDGLRAGVAAAPDDWGKRQLLGEHLLEAGQREAGLQELDVALGGYERTGDFAGARGVADAIIRVDPSSVRHHQKLVEYAFRSGDKHRLSEAYIELADALFRTGETDKALAVYRRVLELAPDDIRARAALSAFAEPAEAAPQAAAPPRPRPRPQTTGNARRVTGVFGVPPVPAPGPTGSGSFVDLGEILREEDTPKSTRMVADEKEPTGDEQADFDDMLRKFKAGVAENVAEDDHESHYDLGVAFKEMGLLDEAIAEFQKALRATVRRVRTYEALGQCFLEKQQLPVALTILVRALSEPDVGDDELVGVLYLLGYTSEAMRKREDAIGYYQRVFAVDIQFRDVADRLAALQQAGR
jgi:tetratricopeptide (TPR) repeat protein